MTTATDTPSLLILGPTATGKSALGIVLAERCNGEIISLDSMQIYQGMDIGTAKPSQADRARCPHHLIDYQPVTAPSDAVQVLERVREAERDVRARGALPILVGGTALYIKLLVDGMFDGPPACPDLRAELSQLATQRGTGHLHAHVLTPLDPDAAARIHPNDLRRIIRAIEVCRLTGSPISSLQTQWSSTTASNYRMIGLVMPRPELYRRIDARVDTMMAAGLADEVRRLDDAGIRSNPTASQAIGYKELLAWLDGTHDLDEAVRLIKRNSRRFAKHQLTWFRRDNRIAWFDVTQYSSTATLADAATPAVSLSSK